MNENDPFNDPDKFIEFVDHVCSRPQMWTVNSTFGEVVAFISGIAFVSGSSPISDDTNHALNQYVTARLLVPSKYWWPFAILQVATDEADAISRLRDLLVEFATLRKSKSFDEICSDVAAMVAAYKETEPARVWRQFLAARYKSDRAEIERLIMPHPKASVLWDGKPAPPGVAEQLVSISNSYVVSVVGGSLESGHVQLVTELGKIDAHLIDNAWRIDASPVIENDIRMRNRPLH